VDGAAARQDYVAPPDTYDVDFARRAIRFASSSAASRLS
jgi:hypothetical protein